MKGNIDNKDIILEENNKTEIATIFIIFFINAAKDIGSNENIKNKNHPSIIQIKENKPEIDGLSFKAVNEEYVTKQTNKLNIKKVTGKDVISLKYLN